jgi:hypothetical protein
LLESLIPKRWYFFRRSLYPEIETFLLGFAWFSFEGFGAATSHRIALLAVGLTASVPPDGVAALKRRLVKRRID